jgi:DNA-binding response OmpR family regulator
MGTKLNILLIEDYRPLRLSLSEFLSDTYKVYSAENGIDALEIIKQVQIELVILDIMLPFPLDGFAILKMLKNDSKLASIPVIIISALDQEEKILFGLENGANDFLVKPFSEKQLHYKINNLLSVKSSIIKKIETDFVIGNAIDKDTTDIFEIDFKKRFDKLVEELVNDQNSSMSTLADKMLVSIATLERWVKKIYGVTPKKYLLNYKLQKAEIMLRQKMGSVNEVAYTLGFNSVSYFCTCFKQKYKQTPNSMLNAKFKQSVNL